MDKSKKIIIIAVIAILIIIGLYFLISAGSKKTNLTGNKPDQAQTSQAANQTVPENSAETATRTAVPENIKIPEVGEKTEAGVAAPTSVSAAAPGVEAKYRSFNIKGETGSFSPMTFIVKKGDTVHINFLAVDKDYDITFPDYGMKQTAKKGETKVLEFQAVTEGKFTYYCEACGGLAGTAKGYFIVAL
jgi:plastocyanin